MMWRPGGIAAARMAHAGVLVAIAAFCFLSYSPFAYGQFIKPNVVPDLNDFVVLSPWLFALTLLVTVLTLLPQLRRPGASGRGAAFAYIAVAGVTAAWALWRRPLITIGNSRAGFLLGLSAICRPVALLVIVALAIWMRSWRIVASLLAWSEAVSCRARFWRGPGNKPRRFRGRPGYRRTALHGGRR